MLAPWDEDRARRPAPPRRAARRRVECPSGWCRSAGRSAGRRTAPSRTCSATPSTVAAAAARAARRATSTSSTSTSRSRPMIGWDALTSADAPLVGTFHCYSESVPPHKVAALLGARRRLNHLTRADRGLRGRRLDRAAASTAARTRVIPNGVALPGRRRARCRALRAAGRAAGDRLRRPGRRAQGPAGAAARLRGAARARGRAELDDRRRDERRRSPRCCSRTRRRHASSAASPTSASAPRSRDADVLAAPSLGGESFGMVLTEAFAAGHARSWPRTSPGYRDVVTRRRATASSSRAATRRRSPRRCAASRSTRRARARARRRRGRAAAERYAWPRSPREVTERLRGGGRRCPRPRARWRSSPCAPACAPPAWARTRAPAGCRRSSRRRRAARRVRRRAAPGRARRRRGIATVAGSYVALERIGVDRIGRSLLDSSPAWVLVGLALMCLSMGFRAVSWHAILKAALPADAAAVHRRLAGHDHRRADVRHAARAPRRALACADRVAAARATARGLPGRARHARVADAAQRRRAA